MAIKRHRYRDMLAQHVKKGDEYLDIKETGEVKVVWKAQADARINDKVVYILVQFGGKGQIVDRHWGANQVLPGIIRRKVNRG